MAIPVGEMGQVPAIFAAIHEKAMMFAMDDAAKVGHRTDALDDMDTDEMDRLERFVESRADTYITAMLAMCGVDVNLLGASEEDEQ